ncbi:hypothetical protein SAOR_07165 [Salinisphaera orenii MK-B5]|uniref:HTH araC/xylS-type domain-containing protein n=1 Tax=Salinisphaera orenii MK-B5 TaxID=856730 RepID=A0A423PQK3_9GAMM|nr:hypothetical protein SAOR_07165 [Salinisphaera orenii MK-B5]
MDAGLAAVDLGDIGLVEVHGNSHVVERSPEEIRRHRTESVFVCLLLEGKAFTYQADDCVTLTAGDGVVYAGDEPYIHGFPSRSRQITFDIPVERFREHCAGWNVHGLTKLNGFTESGKFLFRTLNACAGDLLAGRPKDSVLAERFWPATESLMQLDGQTNPQAPSNLDLLIRAKAMIAEHLCDPDLDCEAISAALRISRRQLHRLFESIGSTPHAWIRERRLDQCAAIFSDPAQYNVRITELCYRMGFNDAAHFCRVFKARFGMSAKEYRATQARIN